MKAVLLKAKAKKMEIVDIAEPVDLCQLGQMIGADYVQIVRAKRLPDSYVMIVDEDGKLKENSVNVPCSVLYGADVHGDPIVGNALIMQEVYGLKGPELAGLTEKDAAAVVDTLRRRNLI